MRGLSANGHFAFVCHLADTKILYVQRNQGHFHSYGIAHGLVFTTSAV